MANFIKYCRHLPRTVNLKEPTYCHKELFGSKGGPQSFHRFTEYSISIKMAKNVDYSIAPKLTTTKNILKNP